MNHYSACPSCNSEAIRAVLNATDHTVSHEEFGIWQCENCGLRFTQDVPDAADIGRYYRSEDYISHTNTSKGLVNRLYHIARQQTLADKYRLILSATRIQQGKLLDIGAGTGAFVAHMKQRGWEVTGLEPDETARERANAVNKVQLLDADHLYSLPPDSFDAITLWHVLEHVHDLHAYLDQLKKLIKREGASLSRWVIILPMMRRCTRAPGQLTMCRAIFIIFPPRRWIGCWKATICKCSSAGPCGMTVSISAC